MIAKESNLSRGVMLVYFLVSVILALLFVLLTLLCEMHVSIEPDDIKALTVCFVTLTCIFTSLLFMNDPLSGTSIRGWFESSPEQEARLTNFHCNKMKKWKFELYRKFFSEIEHIQIKCSGGQIVKFLKPVLKQSPVFGFIIEGHQNLKEIAVKYSHQTVLLFFDMVHYGDMPKFLNREIFEDLIAFVDQYDFAEEFEHLLAHACSTAKFDISLKTCEEIKKMLSNAPKKLKAIWEESNMRKKVVEQINREFRNKQKKLEKERKSKLKLF